jgi:WD40 repeat protein
MNNIGRSVLACVWLICFVAALASAHATDPSNRQETITRPDGSAWTRTVKSCDAPESGQESATAVSGSLGANQYLWIDRSHLNAIPENVAITGDGGHGIVGWWLNNMRVSLYPLAGGTGNPDWVHPLPLAQYQIAVDADFEGDRLTATAEGESLYVMGASSPDAVFTDWFSSPYGGSKCSVADDGSTFAGAGGDPIGVGGEVRVHDGATGALRFVRSLPTPPEGLCVSGDGRVVAANIRGLVKIWDALSGALRDSVLITGDTETPAVLSENGLYLVTGGFSKTVRLYRWNGVDYVQSWANTISSTTWVTALAISRDGTTIVAGTWTNPTGGQVVVYDRTSSTPIWVDSSFGDEVASVAVTADGRKIAAASWGRRGGTVGNVISAYERSSPIPLWTIGDDAITGVGSCMSVDLSEDGHYLLASGKVSHAREFGQGGYVIAIDIMNPAAVPEIDREPAITVSPNPFRESLRIEGEGRGLSGRALSVWSVDGRRIRSVVRSPWDGRDEAGQPVPAGIYFIRGVAPGAAPLRVVRIR